MLHVCTVGSRLQVLSECIPKLIPYSTGVLLIESLPGSVPTPPISHYLHHSHSTPYITGITNSEGQILHLTEVQLIMYRHTMYMYMYDYWATLLSLFYS